MTEDYELTETEKAIFVKVNVQLAQILLAQDMIKELQSACTHGLSVRRKSTEAGAVEYTCKLCTHKWNAQVRKLGD
jgi:hypothetical protein